MLLGPSCGPLGCPLGFLALFSARPAGQRINGSTGQRVNRIGLGGWFGGAAPVSNNNNNNDNNKNANDNYNNNNDNNDDNNNRNDNDN